MTKEERDLLEKGLEETCENPGKRHSKLSSEEGKLFEYAEDQQDAGPLAPDIARYPESFDIPSWDVEPGDSLVFNGNMLHGTGGCEHAAHPRRTFTSLWGLRYFKPKGHAIPTPAELGGHEVPSGSRIGDYRDALPVWWKRE